MGFSVPTAHLLFRKENIKRTRSPAPLAWRHHYYVISHCQTHSDKHGPVCVHSRYQHVVTIPLVWLMQISLFILSQLCARISYRLMSGPYTNCIILQLTSSCMVTVDKSTPNVFMGPCRQLPSDSRVTQLSGMCLGFHSELARVTAFCTLTPGY